MTYLQFFLWLTGIYSIYYLLILLFDWSKQNPQNKDSDIHQLSFIEENPAEKISLKIENTSKELAPEPVSKGLGGVTMKGLFELARKESLNLTSSISF